MSEQIHSSAFLDGDAGKAEAITEGRREAALLKTGALQNAIFNSANFSSIATDEKGVIQIFNVGAERMLVFPCLPRASFHPALWFRWQRRRRA